MNVNRNTQVLVCILVLVISLACSAGGIGQQPLEATPTNTSVPPTVTEELTSTPIPTDTPVPTETPDVVATERYDELFSQVQKFEGEGLIPSTQGEYIELVDFSETWAQLGYYQAYLYDLELENFVFTGHISWSTATETNDVSGCGIVFGWQDDNSDYAMFLDKSRIYFSSSTPKLYSELGKTRGTGRLDFGNPAEAEVSLIVNDNNGYVYVNDVFIGEYTLSESKPLRGRFGYGILSGTNRDYGTRCEVSNARIWDLQP
jgi:hypothetical protein